MIRVKPSFYDRFSCKGSRCRHNCCIGWEIDIDPDTAAFYKTEDGVLGSELLKKISWEEPAHFILCADGRCPFLDGDNLCRIILQLGEDALCDICALHPRFFNDYPGREESGLGLCCEEVVRLLMEAPELRFTVETESTAEDGDEWVAYLALVRMKLLDSLRETDQALPLRLDRCANTLKMALPIFDLREWISFFLQLERMDQNWGVMLERLKHLAGSAPDVNTLNDPRYGKILSYLLFRHFLTAETEEDARLIFAFTVLAVVLIAALDESDPKERDEHLRLFSAEIEYSDENMERIFAKLRERFAFGGSV